MRGILILVTAATLAGCATPEEVRYRASGMSTYGLCERLATATLAPSETREIWARELESRGENCLQFMPTISATQRSIDQTNQTIQQLTAPKAQPTSGGALIRQYVSGVNRVCVYNRLGSEFAMTVGATQLCPLTP